MRLELVKRPQYSTLFSVLSPFIALALTLVAGVILFALLGKNPASAMYYYFVDPLTGLWDPDNRWQLHELAIKAAPLILIAVGLSVCYLSNNWNIGAEGQFIAGAVVGSFIPVVFPEFQSWVVLPLMLLMGIAGGAAYASIPALLKVRFNTNEILTSLMLVYVAQLFNDWLVRGPWRNPQGMSFPGTIRFHDYAILPQIWPEAGRAHWGFIFALVAALVVWFMLARTLKGFEVKVLGQSRRAGRFAGFSSAKMVFFAFLLSGALAGLAGISEAAGPVEQLNEKISIGYGFTAIIVAFLGRLNPLGIVASGLILALTYLGGEAAQISIGVSDKVVRAFQGMILFFVLACDTLIHYRIRLTSGKAVAAPEASPGNV
jgi:general nucleoside transport system permease protein